MAVPVLNELVLNPPAQATLSDLIRWGASCLKQHGLTFAHHHDNALDESRELVLHALHLPDPLPPFMGSAKLLPDEISAVRALLERRLHERVPAAYLTGQAYFAGLWFKTDARALVPRSPMGELILQQFRPWLIHQPSRALDLCTGSGAIGIAMAQHNPGLLVDLIDVSKDALALATENIARFGLAERVKAYQGDLFDALSPASPGAFCYQLIVSNPPYVTESQMQALAPEYAFEPALGLVSGHDGLDITLRILRDSPNYLSEDGLLIVEVGDSERALRKLLPDLSCEWIRFSVGEMGIFIVTRSALMHMAEPIAKLCKARAG